MGDQLANNPEALRLFFNEDIYLLAEPEFAVTNRPITSSAAETETTTQTDTEVKHVVIPINVPEAPDFKLPAVTSKPRQENVAAATASLQEEPSPAYGNSNGTTKQAGVNTSNEAEQEINFSYKGRNARNILILVYDEVNEVTTAEGRELFKNIVKAKELSGSDYAIVNYAGYKDASFAQLKRFFNAKAILTFGVKASQLGLAEYPTHTVVQHEGVQMLFSIDLHQISLDTSIKRALWAALQQMEL